MQITFRLRSALVRVACAAAFAATVLVPTLPAHAAGLEVARLWRHAHNPGNIPNGQKSEIVVHDDRTDTLWVAGVRGVDVLDRATGQVLAQIDLTHLGFVNSVAIHDGLAAMAVESSVDRTQPGWVVFYDTRSRRQEGAVVIVGALPDMLTFTPNGRKVLVANEGTPNPRPTAPNLSATDPGGSVSIVDVRTRTVKTLPISSSIPGFASLRQFPATFSAYDPEPEYIVVDKDGDFAYVGLQEANGVAVLNLRTESFERIYSLGLKDFSLPGNEIDPNDRDSARILRNVPVKGLYQPDGMATYQHEDRTYIVMANEGDSRDNGNGDGEDERRGGAGSGSARLTDDADLARLTLSNIDSARGGQLVAFGARSFSIRDTDGNIVFDSGSQLDREAILRDIYDDGRSDNKGVEPEGVALLKIKGRTLAFIGLERTLKSAVAVYDITDPRKATFLDMIVSEGDLSPEGLAAFKVGDRHYLAVANEVSDTTTLFEVRLDD